MKEECVAEPAVVQPPEVSTKEVRRRKKQLYRAIRCIMEFYFSDANLAKNRFMAIQSRKDPNFELSLFLTFNKVRALTNNVNDIAKAIKNSSMLALTEDGKKVYRTTPVREKVNNDDCSIYVEQLPPDAEHEWLKSVFLPYGNVTYVSIPKFVSSQMNKGFAFVEFDSPNGASRALEAFGAMGCRIIIGTATEKDPNKEEGEGHTKKRKKSQQESEVEPILTKKRKKEIKVEAVEEVKVDEGQKSNIVDSNAMIPAVSEDRNMNLRILRLSEWKVLRDKQRNKTDSKESKNETEEGTEINQTSLLHDNFSKTNCTISVEQLPPKADQEWLKAIFLPYGNITDVSIPKFEISQLNKGFAFIVFETSEGASQALKDFNEKGITPETTEKADETTDISNDCSEEKMQKDSSEVGSEDGTRKRRSHEDPDTSRVKCKRSGQAVETRNEDEKEQEKEQKEVKEVREERTKKKSRAKRKKKSKRESIDDPKMSLRILPLIEWQRLRNKYKALQKSRMNSLKQHLHRSRWGGNYSQEPRDEESQDRVQRTPVESQEKTAVKTIKEFTFVPGVIVRIQLEEPCEDVKTFKMKARTNANVLYVDITEGSNEAHIRMRDSDVAETLVSDRPWPKMSVLQGDEEKTYWEKIRQDRCVKMKQGVADNCPIMPRKRRGRDKLLKKAEKALGKHIRFDEHE